MTERRQSSPYTLASSAWRAWGKRERASKRLAPMGKAITYERAQIGRDILRIAAVAHELEQDRIHVGHRLEHVA